MENFIVVPWSFRFVRRLDLDKVHGMHHATVLTYLPFGEKIIDRQLPHLGRDSVSVRRPCGLYRLEIVQHRRIGPGLNHPGHTLIALEEPPRPRTSCVIEIPIKRRGEYEAVCGSQTESVHIGYHNN